MKPRGTVYTLALRGSVAIILVGFVCASIGMLGGTRWLLKLGALLFVGGIGGALVVNCLVFAWSAYVSLNSQGLDAIRQDPLSAATFLMCFALVASATVVFLMWASRMFLAW